MSGLNSFITAIAGLLIFHASHARAADPSSCKTTYNLPKFLETPRDQGDLRWCYAYASADLVSAYAGKKVSAAEIAINHNASQINMTYVKSAAPAPDVLDLGETGNLASFLQTSNTFKGFCPEEVLPSDPIVKINPNDKKRMSEILNISLPDRLLAATDLGRDHVNPMSCSTSLATTAFPNIRPAELAMLSARMSRYHADRDGSYGLYQMAAVNCDPKRIPAPFEEKDLTVEPLSNEGMHRILDGGGIATVAVPSVPLLTPASPEALKRFKDDRLGLEQSADPHAMLLVGRRWNPRTNDCDFIFKNSWGSVSSPDGKTVKGFTVLPGSQLAQVARGDLLSVNKPPSWKKAPLPDFLK